MEKIKGMIGRSIRIYAEKDGECRNPDMYPLSEALARAGMQLWEVRKSHTLESPGYKKFKTYKDVPDFTIVWERKIEISGTPIGGLVIEGDYRPSKVVYEGFIEAWASRDALKEILLGLAIGNCHLDS